MMFRIPTITKNLLIINLIAFLATIVLQLRGIDLADIGGLHFYMANDFHLYQFVTYLFLHANFMHILSNMFGLWMFGCVIENVWGGQKVPFLLHIMWNRRRTIAGNRTVGTVLHDDFRTRPKRIFQ